MRKDAAKARSPKHSLEGLLQTGRNYLYWLRWDWQTCDGWLMKEKWEKGSSRTRNENGPNYEQRGRNGEGKGEHRSHLQGKQKGNGAAGKEKKENGAAGKEKKGNGAAGEKEKENGAAGEQRHEWKEREGSQG